jgi:DNA-directed RNA polymerase subunit RPC12/RpoP
MAGQYRCPMCGASFQEEAELKEHAKTHMAGQKQQGTSQYRCSVCGASFQSEQDLQEHQKTHMSK